MRFSNRATYCVTGGAGFIGSHLVRALLERGMKVRVLDNFSTGKMENLDGCNGADIIKGDIRNMKMCMKAVKGAHYVLHQAALPSVQRSVVNPIETHNVNATGTLNMLIASRDCRVRRLIYAGSSSAYGGIGKRPASEDMPPKPLSPYGASKLMGEFYCRVFTGVYGLETVVLRYFNVFGPNQDPTTEYAAVIPKFISLMRRGGRPPIYGDGEQTRDFTYVDNVVHGNLLACRAKRIGGRFSTLPVGG
jgi:nucleoside-diphosphate-sugar epimerase